MNKRITAAAVFFLAAATALAEPVGAEQAAEKVVAAVKTHKLTSLETECLTLVYSNEGRMKNTTNTAAATPKLRRACSASAWMRPAEKCRPMLLAGRVVRRNGRVICTISTKSCRFKSFQAALRVCGAA